MEWFALIVIIGIGAGAALFAGDIIGGGAKAQDANYGSAYSEEQIEEFKERERKWREEFEAKNPVGPPISDEEHAAFKAWLDQQDRPALRLTPSTDGVANADGSRLGGPVALAEGQPWPVSERGHPMEFLAQLDFADLPPLDGFPTDGVLQFFILQDDDLWGMDINHPQGSDVAVLYRPNGEGADNMTPNPTINPAEAITPFRDLKVRERGIALNSEAYSDTISSSNWVLATKLDGNLRRPGFDQWEALLESRETDKPLIHHTGGYAAFVQWDFRQPGHLDDYDTVLLRLTSDDYVQWGDVGEANFLIRSEDLARRDFSKVIFWWDSH